MKPFSFCIIAKNEESNIERCLKSVQNFDCEIIVVDTSSTDRTKEIAGQYATKVLDFKWIDDFSAARNFSLDNASYDWVLILDCDEWIQSAEPQKFMELAKNPDDPYLYFQIGQEYYCEDDYENAAAYYGKVLTYDLPPTMEYLLMTMQAYGNCLLALNRIEEFIKATSMSNPHAEGTNTYLSWYYIALIYEKMGELDIARNFYQKCGDFEPALKRLSNI